MENKLNDLYLTMTGSPDATVQDLVAAGLTVDNTSLQDYDVYRSNEKVQDRFRKTDGTIDEIAMRNAYDAASDAYNNMADMSYSDTMLSLFSYHRDNVFAPVLNRRQGPDFYLIKMSNPYELVYNMVELGRVENPTKTVDELALSHSVLLNPKTAGDNLENALWGDAPGGNLGKYFWDTLVLAQYDEDDLHIDPITGEMVQHKKGDMKFNNNGDFYYEKLDGRNPSGKMVLNKMNILTVDGSRANQYDFFDSDDMEQKDMGSVLLRNLALVGSMFIPGVGPWIAGINVAVQSAGFLSTLAKIGSVTDNQFLNNVEGFAKSWDRSTAKTQYAQENTWCVENFIDMIGDFLAFTRELRFIFEKVPYIFKGTNPNTDLGKATKILEIEKMVDEANNTRFAKALADGKFVSNPNLLAQARVELDAIKAVRTLSELQSFTKGYQKLGELLSRSYIVLNSAANTYEEAKRLGASEIDATLLTIGHAAAEYGLLATGVGKWIFPELRADRYRSQAIAKALVDINQGNANLSLSQVLRGFDKKAKMDFVKRVFNVSKNLARAEYSNGTKSAIATLGTSISGGVELMSFDLLRDLSNGCYNVVKWLNNDNHRMSAFGYNAETGETDRGALFDKYAMSFLSGSIGGALTNYINTYKMVRNVGEITKQQAMLELVYMVRNGDADKFLKLVDGMTIGNPHLAMVTDDQIHDGRIVFRPGTENDNQDLASKTMIRRQVLMIKETLAAEGADLSDATFLDKQTLGDLRFNALQHSLTASDMLNRYNSLSAELVDLVAKIQGTQDAAIDTNNNGFIEDREQRRARDAQKGETKEQKAVNENAKLVEQYTKRLREVRKQIKDLLDGKETFNFLGDSLFEMTYDLSRNLTTASFLDFTRAKYGKDYNDLSNAEKADATSKYDEWIKSDARTRVREMAAVFRLYSRHSSNTIIEHGSQMLQQSEITNQIDRRVSDIYRTLQQIPQLETSDEYISRISDINNPESAMNISFRMLQQIAREILSDSEINELNTILQRMREVSSSDDPNKANLLMSLVDDYDSRTVALMQNNLNKITLPLFERGYANQTTKDSLVKMFNKITDMATHNISRLRRIEDDSAGRIDTKQRIQFWQDYIDQINGTNENGEHLPGIIDRINELDNSPFFTNINLFANVIGKGDVNLSQLEKKVTDIYENVIDDPSRFQLDDSVMRELRDALSITQMYRAAIMAARTDSAEWGNYFGYNATLNEVAEKLGESNERLAEITTREADLLVSDIDAVLNKLKYLYELLLINQSQKMTRLDRVATRMQLKIYLKLKIFTTIPEGVALRNWEGFDDFVAAINSAELHEALLTSGRNSLSKEETEQLEREKIQMEDAIYNFFNKESNMKRLNDPEQILLFINEDYFNLFTTGKGLLNEDTESIDDNAMMWYIASRIAVKSSDFFASYSKIINPEAERPIAPIPTQEQGIYMAFAHIMNGNIFNKIYDASRKAMVRAWKNMDQDRRVEVLLSIDFDEGYATEAADDYILNVIPVPKYTTMMFLEGIAGAGKTEACLVVLNKLLLKHGKDLLKNVFIVHGVDSESAEHLKKTLGLDKATHYDVIGLMKRITGGEDNYKPPVLENGVYQIDDDQFTFNETPEGKEIRSTIPVLKDSAPPSLIYIDEISRFDSYQLDALDRYAQAHGVRIVTSGDLDQIGVVGEHELELPFAPTGKLTYDIELQKTNFIRFQKLGVSMRTQNALMTEALNMLQAFLQNPTDSLTFKYFEGELGTKDAGLHGIKVYSISEDPDDMRSLEQILEDQSDDIMNDIRLMVEDAKAAGEKSIGYIVDDINSPIYQRAVKEFGSFNDKDNHGFIDGFVGGRELGKEGKYFIVEPGTDYDEYYNRKLNTGITRAKLGVLLILKWTNGMPKLNSQAYDRNITEATNEAIIRNFADNRKKLLEKIVPKGNAIEYKKPTLKDNTLVAEPVEVPEDDGDNDTESDIIDIPETKTPEGEEEPDKSIYVTDDNKTATGDGTANDDKDQKKAQESSETKKMPKCAIADTGRVRMVAHSFNQLGVSLIKNRDGKYELPDDPTSNQTFWSKRVDNVIGLIKLELGLPGDISKDKKAINRMKKFVSNLTDDDVMRYLQILGDASSVLYNADSKYETAPNMGDGMVDLLSRILEVIPGVKNVKNTYVTFALKSTKRLSSTKAAKGHTYGDSLARKGGSQAGFPTRFGHSVEEKIIYNGSHALHSDEVNDKGLIAIVGTTYTDADGNEHTGDILEVPMIQLTSAFTLAKTKDSKGRYHFGELSEFVANSDTNMIETALGVIERFDKDKPGYNEKYDDILSLFKFFLVDYNNVAFIDNDLWTPARNLRNCGPLFVIKKGEYDIMSGREYDRDYTPEEEWTTVRYQSQNPRAIMSSIMISDHNTYEVGLPKPLKLFRRGVPFVLISYDKSLITSKQKDKALLDYYAKLQSDPNVPKKVHRMDVLPPKATISEYMLNIYKVYLGEKNFDNIGLLMTSYKILSRLMSSRNPQILELIKNRLNDVVYKNRLPKTLERIDKTYDPETGKYDFDLVRSILMEVQNWSEFGISNKAQHIVTLLDNVLFLLGYISENVRKPNNKKTPRNRRMKMKVDPDSIKLIEDVLKSDEFVVYDDDGNIVSDNRIDGVYYNVKIAKDPRTRRQINGVDIVSGVNRYYQLVCADGVTMLDFRIHGKIDSPAFQDELDTTNKGYLIGLVDKFLENDNDYKTRYNDYNSKLSEKPATERKPKKESVKKPKQDPELGNDDKQAQDPTDKIAAISNKFNNILSKYNITGINFPYAGTNPDEAMDAAVMRINSNSDSGGLAIFRFNDDFVAWKDDERITSGVQYYIEGENGSRITITNLLDGRLGGTETQKEFKAEMNGEIYDVIIELDTKSGTISKMVLNKYNDARTPESVFNDLVISQYTNPELLDTWHVIQKLFNDNLSYQGKTEKAAINSETLEEFINMVLNTDFINTANLVDALNTFNEIGTRDRVVIDALKDYLDTFKDTCPF